MSINGEMVSLLWSQNSSLDFLPRNSAEYSRTAMSCNPPSVFLVKVDRYEKSLGIADDAFADKLGTPAIMLVRTVDVRRGIGLSGSFDCARSGRKGL